MNLLTLFKRGPCLVCLEKERLIAQLREDLSRDRLRLTMAVEREHLAVDRLLQQRGERGVTPPQKMSTLEADTMMKDTFAIFKDQDDTGDGRIREVDALDHDQPRTK